MFEILSYPERKLENFIIENPFSFFIIFILLPTAKNYLRQLIMKGKISSH